MEGSPSFFCAQSSSDAAAAAISFPINDAIVDYIVRVVNVTHETVIDCVKANKCDDVAAMYHMLSHSIKEAEREEKRQHAHAQLGPGVPQVVLSASPGPPLSPTSMSPFFQVRDKIPDSKFLLVLVYLIGFFFFFPFRERAIPPSYLPVPLRRTQHLEG